VRFLLVNDTLEPCPYIPGQTARLPLRMPTEPLAPEAFDALLAQGDRRFGPFLYRTACPACTACEPIRVPATRFAPTRSQRRVLRKNPDVEVTLGEPTVTARHLEIYNRHQFERKLARTTEKTTESEYRLHLVQSCVTTREVRYAVAGKLIAISILDVGRTSASSVYHAFDPDESARSLGVFSVLKEIEMCKEKGLEWYYLGLYVGACKSLAYKATYYPHQRKIAGEWREFSSSP
jgi:arginyl-tRNA--protein-N-Asp/Glu arginylyltransferase